jgi:hypothetical protein
MLTRHGTLHEWDGRIDEYDMRTLEHVWKHSGHLFVNSKGSFRNSSVKNMWTIWRGDNVTLRPQRIQQGDTCLAYLFTLHCV